jgi:gliding motility-associated-like protein
LKSLHYYFCFLALYFCNISLQAQPLTAHAGSYQKICPRISVGLGGNPTASGGIGPYKYKWYPNTQLNNDTLPNPTSYPLVTTTYTVFVTDAHGAMAAPDTVTVFVFNGTLDAGPDVTIQQGQTITMHANAPGNTGIYWAPSTGNIYNQNSATPDVFPNTTTTYSVSATFPHNCVAYDEVTVTVIPTNNLFFYNTFTPNGDGSNDVFHIGNIERYPDNVLEIYNRYGQKVFSKTGYTNDWDGKYFNEDLPAGTYFYVLDTKNPSGGKHKGSVTIIR